MSPLKLLSRNGKYVLAAFDSEKDCVVYIYPERMLGTSILRQPRDGKAALDEALDKAKQILEDIENPSITAIPDGVAVMVVEDSET